ncbi:hypothetical protein ACFQI9_00925 [Paraburkholderia dipogonis]
MTAVSVCSFSGVRFGLSEALPVEKSGKHHAVNPSTKEIQPEFF